MNATSLAPCGVICDICLGFQRAKNRCVGCNAQGNKPYHCTVCSIKSCTEKDGDPSALCGACKKFPCRRIKDLNKRYISKYGEDLLENLRLADSDGIEAFIAGAQAKWRCSGCGHLLCVHRGVCPRCGALNPYYPQSDTAPGSTSR